MQLNIKKKLKIEKNQKKDKQNTQDTQDTQDNMEDSESEKEDKTENILDKMDESTNDSSKKLKLSPLEEILQSEHNHFSCIRILLIEDIHNGRKLPKTPQLAKMTTGNASAYSHYTHGNIGVSRGGKEGNNAFLEDTNVFYSSYFHYSNLSNQFSSSLNSVLTFPTVSFPALRSMYYILSNYKEKIYLGLPTIIRSGNRRLAARFFHEFKDQNTGDWDFGRIHSEILTYEHEQELSKIRTPASATKRGWEGITPIHCACIQSTGKYLRELLKLKPEAINLPDSLEYEPIHYAAASESPEPLKVLLEHRVNIRISNNNVSPPLTIAARYGRLENIKLLIDNCETLLEKKLLLEQSGGSFNNTALHEASIHNQIDSITLLVEISKNIADEIINEEIKLKGDELKRKPTTTLSNYLNRPNKQKKSPLALACKHGNMLAVETLLKLGAKINQQDKTKKTPLIESIINGCLQVTSYLINQGADPNLCDSSNNSPLHYASAYGWKEIVKFLLNPKGNEKEPLPGVGLSANCFNDWKATPLGIAIGKQHIGIADILLQSNDVHVNITNDEGLSLVAQTCKSELSDGSLHQLDYLVNEKNADVDYIDLKGSTAIHHLIENTPKYPPLERVRNSITMEFEMKPNDELLKKYNEECYYMEEMTKILLKNNNSLNISNHDGLTPLQLAIKKENFSIIKLLIENGADVMYINPITGENIIHELIKIIHHHSIIDILNFIKDKIGNILFNQLLENEDNWGFTPFIFFFRNKVKYVTEKKELEIIQETLVYFIECTNISILSQNVGKLKQWREFSDDILKSKKNLLLQSKKQEYLLNQMKKSKKENEISSINNDGDNNWKITSKDLSYLDNPKQYQNTSFDKYEDRNTIIKGEDNNSIIQEKEISLYHPGYGNWGKTTILHMIPSSNELSEFLFKNYSNELLSILDKKNVHGYAPIHLALEKNQYNVVDYLLNLGASINIPCGNINSLNYPIHYSILSENKQLLRRILKLNPSGVDVINAEKQTALSIACKIRWKKGVLILIQAESNINHKDSKNQNPLHLAIQSASSGSDARFDIEEILLNHNVDVNSKDIYKRTPLFYALCNNSDDISSLYSRNYDPIETVSSLCSVEEILVDEPDCLGNTPLSYASIVGATISSLYLLRRGAQVNHENNDGNTPLGLALQSKKPDFGIVLIQNGADVSHSLISITKQKYTIWREIDASDYELIIKSKQSFFKFSLTYEWQGVAYTMLDSGFDYQQAIYDALNSLKFSYLETLLRKTRSIKEFTVVNDKNMNLFHLLAKICNSKKGYWSLLMAKQFRRKLVNPGALDNNGRTPLHYAAINFNFELCKYFLAKQNEIVSNIDSDDDDEIMDTSESVGDTIINSSFGCEQNANLKDNFGYTPFTLLFSELTSFNLPVIEFTDRFLKIVKEFVKYNADTLELYPKSKGSKEFSDYISPLHGILTFCKNRSNVRKQAIKLFENLFDGELNGNFSIDSVDGLGRTCLMKAIIMNDISLVEFLLRLGAGVDVCDLDGKTVIHYVINPLPYGTYENTKILDILIKSGAPINQKDNFGHTPLYYAKTEQTSMKLYNHLISLGAKLEKRTPLSRTPTVFPKKEDYPEVPNINFDADELLKEVRVSISEKPLKLDKHIKKKGARELYYDSDEIPYHVILTKVDVRKGNFGMNCFYKIQLVHDTLKDVYIVFTKWGRIGSDGQYQQTPFNSIDDAIKEFTRVYKQKTGNVWGKKFSRVNGKYNLHEENRTIMKMNDILLPIDSLLQKLISEGKDLPECKLNPSVKNVMADFCDITKMRYLLGNVYQLKTPLGFLKVDSLKKSITILHEIQQLIDELNDKKKSFPIDTDAIRIGMERIISLSNDFYELVPQEFEYDEGIIAIEDTNTLKTMYNKVKRLLYIAIAVRMLLGAQYKCIKDNIHPYDYIYSCLSTFIKPLDKNSQEYNILLKSIPNNKKVLDIFIIQRRGEADRISKWKDTPNHYLLWHGSQTSNYLGILFEGLRIAPPEAPTSGMLFGRGIYHSDAFIKAENYVSKDSNSYVMMNEVVLGNINTIRKPEYIEKAPVGFDSTKGEGKNQPISEEAITLPNGLVIHMNELIPQASDYKNPYQVNYNEYIVYDPSQVRMRYLVKFQ